MRCNEGLLCCDLICPRLTMVIPDPPMHQPSAAGGGGAGFNLFITSTEHFISWASAWLCGTSLPVLVVAITQGDVGRQ